MKGTALEKSVFEMLVEHLVNIEEEKERLLGKYFPETTEEREVFKDLMNSYIKEVEGYISNVRVINNLEETLPFVIIGSIVGMKSLQYGSELEKLQIVSPFECEFNPDMDVASYLSPMGKALLLSKLNDEVTVKTPIGQMTYIIKSIEIPRELFIRTQGDAL